MSKDLIQNWNKNFENIILTWYLFIASFHLYIINWELKIGYKNVKIWKKKTRQNNKLGFST